VIEGGSVKQITVTNQKGRFEVDVPAGTYSAYVRPMSGKVSERLKVGPFRVNPGSAVEIELDPTAEFVYCSRAGERVVPVRSTDGEENNLKGLRRPKLEEFLLDPSNKESLRVRIEYCGRTKLENNSIRYQSSVVRFDTISILGDDLVFDPQSYIIEGFRSVFVQQGRRDEIRHLKRALNGGTTVEMGAEDVSAATNRLRVPR
jgi:hypothetical protein